MGVRVLLLLLLLHTELCVPWALTIGLTTSAMVAPGLPTSRFGLVGT